MIIGIGIDVVDIEEINESLREDGFRQKVFTTAEMMSVQRYRYRAEHLAGKFAAKQAFMKALGAGIQQKIEFAQIEVLNDQVGKPYISLSGEAEKRFDDCKAKQIHVSVSLSAGVAAAVVVLEA